jgi:hypothetical protein
MTGFRDMTFCTYYHDCAAAPRCHRPLTPDVQAAARAWWGKDGAPIVTFVEKPKCHEEVKP